MNSIPTISILDSMEPDHKRARVSENVSSRQFEIGDEVRLVNLPAYPGLEGLTGVVLSLDDKSSTVDVELHKTKVVKRVCHFHSCSVR